MNDDSRLDHNRYMPSTIYLFCLDNMMKIMRQTQKENYRKNEYSTYSIFSTARIKNKKAKGD